MSTLRKYLNDYKVQGDVTIIYAIRKGNSFEIIIDTDDLPKMLELNKSWYLDWNKSTNSHYAVTGFYLGKENGKVKQKRLSLQHFLMPINPGEKIDHINHNTLDYRRENLRVVSNMENTRNRKGKNSNNTSGYRNVTWMGKHWRVQLQKEGKNVLFPEKFDNPKEAGDFAESMRSIFYGAFAGNG
jgi:hypothetical protein